MGEPRWVTMVILHVGLAKKDTKCHPKRVFKPCRGKNDEPKSESVAGSASTSDNDSEKKKKIIPSAVVEDLWLAEI